MSLFNDSQLLEALFKIAQDNPQFARLQNLALKMINNLKQDYNPVQYTGAIRMSDLADPAALNTWLRNNNATVNGEPIAEDDGIRPERLKVFLSDLQSQSTEPHQKEMVANLINRLNRNMPELGLEPYAAEKPKAEEPAKPAEKAQPGPPQAAPGQPPTAQPTPTQQQHQRSLSLALSQLLINNQISLPQTKIAVDNIVAAIYQLLPNQMELANLGQYLKMHGDEVNASIDRYSELTQGNFKASNFNLPANSSVAYTIKKLNDIFDNQEGKYTSKDFINFLGRLSVIMSNIRNFIGALLSTPQIITNLPGMSEVLEKQQEIAASYEQLFSATISSLQSNTQSLRR